MVYGTKLIDALDYTPRYALENGVRVHAPLHLRPRAGPPTMSAWHVTANSFEVNPPMLGH